MQELESIEDFDINIKNYEKTQLISFNSNFFLEVLLL